MNGEDSRGNYNYQHRMSNPHKNSYSPNSTYYGNTGYNNQQHQQHSQHPQQQQRRRPPNKINPGNNNDRLMKQNDIIIALLREIRDRLPAPTGSATLRVQDENSRGVAMQNDEMMDGDNGEETSGMESSDDDTMEDQSPDAFDVDKDS